MKSFNFNDGDVIVIMSQPIVRIPKSIQKQIDNFKENNDLFKGDETITITRVGNDYSVEIDSKSGNDESKI